MSTLRATRASGSCTTTCSPNKVFGWEQIGRFRPSQYLLMHSVIYRTQLLRDCGLELPKHTFYVDNIFVYQPLPGGKNIYYLDVDLYRYFIGRSGPVGEREGHGHPGGISSPGHLSDDRLPTTCGQWAPTTRSWPGICSTIWP